MKIIEKHTPTQCEMRIMRVQIQTNTYEKNSVLIEGFELEIRYFFSIC